jgi:class 3 adenylate cyclase
MEPTKTRLLAPPFIASLVMHAAAVPFAAALGEASCPLLEATGFGGVGFAMLITQVLACAVYWAGQKQWTRLWAVAAAGRSLSEPEVVALFQGTLGGVFVHVGGFLAATLVGALTLHTMYGHDVFNLRFWYSSMLVAGFVVVLHAALLEWLLARDVARAGSRMWRYRAPAAVLSLNSVVLFAVATLPVGVTAALVYRRVVLDGRVLTQSDLLKWLLALGAICTAWSVAVVALLGSVQRRAANEALALIRELGRPVIARRANLTMGGAWGETVSALNVAADSLEERARLEHAVRTYVGDELADATQKGDVTGARPERCRMTVLFADIRGFTSRSATIPPEDVVAMLDVYFERAVAVVEKHAGHVDKFLGDGLMAWFVETAGTTDLGAARGVAAAQELLRSVAALNAEFATRGIAPIQIGVGLHAGEVVRGNLGAGHRKQWTVIGDTVNLASRMESMTKALERDILFTAPVAAQLPAGQAEPLGDHEVRGQPRPIACFSVRAA